MVVKVNRPLLREQRVEAVVVERMRVRALLVEDHQVGDVDDANSQSRHKFTKKGGSGDDLECHLDTDTNQDAKIKVGKSISTEVG